MCPSRRSLPDQTKQPSPSLVDNSHNERTGLSVLSIHTESVFGTLGCIGLVVMFGIMMICIYKYVKARTLMPVSSATPAVLPTMSYTSLQRSAPAVMEALGQGHGVGQRIIRNFSQDDLDQIQRIVRTAGR